jgi:hypothetical protein
VVGLTSLTQDISQQIDPETGQLISGRVASIAVRLSSLLGIGIPVAIADKNKRPWVVEFADVLGNMYTFRVSSSNPDRTIGVVSCLLEKYDR